MSAAVKRYDAAWQSQLANCSGDGAATVEAVVWCQAVAPGAANDNQKCANDNNPTRAQNPSYTDFPTYNGHNQLTKFAWWQNVTHAAAGNTVADVNRTYKWDFEGRLIRIEFPNNPGYIETYGYDGLGRRIVNKLDNHGSITQQTRVWCGERPCQLRNNTLSLRRYLLNGEYDNVSGERSLYLTDSRGSVRDFVSVVNGARIGAVDYTAYGQQRQTTGTQPHFQYAGLMWDGQAGIYWSYTRPYEAGLARWLTRDWIREEGGINLYSYSGANPVMNIDPSGTVFWAPLWLCAANPVCAEATIAGTLFIASFFIPQAGEVLESMPAGGVAVEAKAGVKAVKEIIVSRAKYCDAADHIADAIKAGYPDVLTIDRSGAAAMRSEALQDMTPVPGLDRDEFPPAMFSEGGAGASRRYVNPSHNRGVGSCVGNQCRGLPDGTPVKIVITE